MKTRIAASVVRVPSRPRYRLVPGLTMEDVIDEYNRFGGSSWPGQGKGEGTMILNQMPWLVWTGVCTHSGWKHERQVFVDAGTEDMARKKIKEGYALVHGISEAEVELYNLASLEGDPANFDYARAESPLILYRHPTAQIRAWIEDAGSRMSALRNTVILWKLGQYKAARTLVAHYRLTSADLPSGICGDDRKVFRKMVRKLS